MHSGSNTPEPAFLNWVRDRVGELVCMVLLAKRLEIEKRSNLTLARGLVATLQQRWWQTDAEHGQKAGGGFARL